MLGRRLPQRALAAATLAAATLATGLLAAATLAGCDEPLLCDGPFITQRSPVSLACVMRQLASPTCPNIPPPPPWPTCRHPCEQIRNEATCAATGGCRVTRELCGVFDDRCEREGPFIGCFPIGTAEPAEGACVELGAVACATRDDCGAQYLHGPDCPQPPTSPDAPTPDGPSCHFDFVTCFDERTPPE
jgi:hypothetical protein